MTTPRKTARRRKATQAAPRPTEPNAEPRGHERLAVGAAAVTMLGLGIVGTRASDLGAVVTLLGLASLMLAVHRYGRLGVEDGATPTKTPVSPSRPL
ncbi:MAG: hypothetical protein FJ096_06675 [Deltaproteobacteria bacterium]|nr:hypothetical protein [Deltaproteobacteria bacterium]